MISRQRLVSSVSRLYPFYSGCATFANHSLVQRIAGVNDETVWTRVSGGEVLGDFVGRAAYYAGELDRKITWICSRLIRPGDTVMDIGANIGIVTVCMAKLVGSSGRVHSFEPNPSLVQLLRQVIEHNQLANVKLHPVALGQDEGRLELRIPKFNAGAASLVRNYDLPDCEPVSVPVRRLSAIAAEESIRTVRLIKIDVEGYEAEVFLGGRELLQSAHPDAILFEFNERTKASLSEYPLIKILLEHNYDLLAVPRAMVRMRLQRVDPNGMGPIGHDFLAVARGDQYKDILARMNVRPGSVAHSPAA